MGSNNASDRETVEVKFERLCECLALPCEVKTQAWNVFQDFSSKTDANFSFDTSDWLMIAVYTAVIDSSSSTKMSPCVTLTELLQKAGSSVIKFTEKMRQFREDLCLSDQVRQHVTSIEKRYCIISPLYIRFEREWGTVFREEEENNSVPFTQTERLQYKKELCWVIFLLAKDGLLSASLELIHTYHLLLCCLEYVMCDMPSFQLQPPFDTWRQKFPDNLDKCGHSSVLLQMLAEHFQTDYNELQAIQIQIEAFLLTLKNKNGELDIVYLRNKYHEKYRQFGGLDELMFLNNDSHLMPEQNRSQITAPTSTTEAPVTPVRAALNTIQQLKNILSTSGQEACDELKKYFQNCANNPETTISGRVEELRGRFCECYMEKTSTEQLSTADQRFSQAVILYYRVMKTLLDMEKERLSLSDFSSLLNNDTFHKSLLACSAEIVLVTYNISWNPSRCLLESEDYSFAFPWVLEVFNLYAYDFFKVLESFIKAEPNLTREIVQHLTQIENKILDSLAWKPDSPVFEAIAKSDSSASGIVQGSPSKDFINCQGAASAAELYLSPVRGQRTRGVSPGSVVFASPRKMPNGSATNSTIIYSRESPDAKHSTNPKRSHSLNMFLNKACRLGYHRLIQLCDLLHVSKDVQQKIWTCFEICITCRPELMRNRHLDQILMCSLYGICKVSETEIKFKDIVKCYSMLPHAEPQTYKQTYVKEDQYESIIAFYNLVYMQNMKTFILQFAKPIQPTLSPAPRPVSSPHSASPVYRIPGRQNFYVSPMKESPFKSPNSPGNMTPRSRQLYSFGELHGSAEKLKSINDTLSAFKSRSNVQYVTTPRRGPGKRLSFDAADDGQNSPSHPDDSSPTVVIKKKRITPPNAVTENSDTLHLNGNESEETKSHAKK